jgi:hypothetical protein
MTERSQQSGIMSPDRSLKGENSQLGSESPSIDMKKSKSILSQNSSGWNSVTGTDAGGSRKGTGVLQKGTNKDLNIAAGRPHFGRGVTEGC